MENRGLGRQLINALETGVHVHKLEKIRQDRGVPRVYLCLNHSRCDDTRQGGSGPHGF